LLAFEHMTLKGLFMLGGVIAGAAYLGDKQRRDRLAGRARDLIDQAKTRAADISRQVEAKVDEVVDSTKRSEPAGSSYSTYGSPGTYR
jgi:hypothetical protein